MRGEAGGGERDYRRLGFPKKDVYAICFERGVIRKLAGAGLLKGDEYADAGREWVRASVSDFRLTIEAAKASDFDNQTEALINAANEGFIAAAAAGDATAKIEFEGEMALLRQDPANGPAIESAESSRSHDPLVEGAGTDVAGEFLRNGGEGAVRSLTDHVMNVEAIRRIVVDTSKPMCGSWHEARLSSGNIAVI